MATGDSTGPLLISGAFLQGLQATTGKSETPDRTAEQPSALAPPVTVASAQGALVAPWGLNAIN